MASIKGSLGPTMLRRSIKCRARRVWSKPSAAREVSYFSSISCWGALPVRIVYSARNADTLLPSKSGIDEQPYRRRSLGVSSGKKTGSLLRIASPASSMCSSGSALT